MALLTKQEILDADDLPTRDVPVPEWGGDVRVRGLTGRERDAFEMRMAVARRNGDTDVDLRASLVGRCIVDEDGERLFTDRELGQLARKSGAALDAVFDVVRELSGMTADSVDESAGNFDATDGDGSHSG